MTVTQRSQLFTSIADTVSVGKEFLAGKGMIFSISFVFMVY